MREGGNGQSISFSRSLLAGPSRTSGPLTTGHNACWVTFWTQPLAPGRDLLPALGLQAHVPRDWSPAEALPCPVLFSLPPAPVFVEKLFAEFFPNYPNPSASFFSCQDPDRRHVTYSSSHEEIRLEF